MSASLVLLYATALAAREPQGIKPYELTPGFRVSLPGKPVAAHDPTGSAKVWTVSTNLGLVYVVGMFPIENKAKTPSDQVLFNMAAGYLHGSKGTLTGIQDIVQDGWPGLEIRFKIPDQNAAGWLRNYLIGDTGYQVCVLSTFKGGDMPGARSVFDSVKLPKPVGPLKQAGPTLAPYAFPKIPVSVLLPGTPKVDEQTIKDNPYGLVIHRAVANYAGRTYVYAYGELPAEAVEHLTAESMPAFLEKANLDVTQSFKAKNVKSHSYKVGENTFFSTEFASPDGAMFGRVDSIVFDGRLYSFLALVPLPMKASSEVSRFYGSIKLGDK